MRLAKKSKTLRKTAQKLAGETPANGRLAAEFLAVLGREVRRSRAKSGMTRRQLALASRTSERYLAQIESGAGNPSVTVLRAIAQALDIPAAALLAEPGTNNAARASLLELIARLPEATLPELTKLAKARLLPPPSAEAGSVSP